MKAEQIVKKIDEWLMKQCKDETIPQEERIVYSKVLYHQRNCMLSESYIKSRLQILRNWVIKNTNLQGDDIDILANKIFMKYYAKCM